MKTNNEEFAAKLDRSFPKTPESFRQAVSREICVQMSPVSNNVRMAKRKKRLYKSLLPIVACLVLAGSTVAAARLPEVQNWLNELGINAEEAEKSVIRSEDTWNAITMETTAKPELEESGAQEAPPFQVTDVYYDGATLMFWVKPKNDFFELGDHVYINGIDSRLEYVAETEEGSGIYECKVSVVDEALQSSGTNAINVKVGVYTSPDSKSDYSFTVESDKLGSAAQSSGNVDGLNFGKVASYDVTVSPSVISLHLEWEVQDESMMEILRWGDYVLEDASSRRLTSDAWLRSNVCSIPKQNQAGGSFTFSQDLEIKGFDASSPTMKIIPVYVEWDSDGNKIPDSEKSLEDCAVMIDLTK